MGRHVLDALREGRIEFVVVGRNRPPELEGGQFIAADLLDGSELAPVMQRARASHLLHLAWYAEYGKFWTSTQNFRWVAASLRLVHAFCEAGGKRVVAAGSCAEYDWFQGYLREDHASGQPTTTYGVAKDATRRLLESLCRDQGATFAWGHIFFPFGPGEARQRMIPSLIDVFLGRREPFGVNVDAYRGMLYVPDAAQAFLTLLRSPLQGRFNICSGMPERIGDVVCELARLCAADPHPVLALSSVRPADPHLLVGENTRLLNAGWRPVWALNDGLAATVEFHKHTTPHTSRSSA